MNKRELKVLKTKLDNEKFVENEFSRIADCLVSNGDVDVLTNMIPLETKKEFIFSWHDEEGS